jgi:thiol-disulfide isomerase/thioredoxin
MKRLLAAVVVALLPVALGGSVAATANGMDKFIRAPEPRPAPDVEFTELGGNPAHLSDFRGRVVLVNLWATWCAPCVKEMPSLVKLQQTIGTRDFVVVALSSDRGGARVVEPFLEENGLRPLAVFLDPKASATRKLGAKGLPTSILLDRQGREIGRMLGGADWDSSEAVALVRGAIDTVERAERGR